MAFNSSQTSVTYFGGNTPALVRITGFYACDGGTTGGVIAPGYDNAAGTFSAVTTGPGAGGEGANTILGAVGAAQAGGVVTITPTTNDATAPGGETSFNATLSRTVFTLVCTANSTGTYEIWCLNNGAQP
jgi:hypothetical protein